MPFGKQAQLQAMTNRPTQPSTPNSSSASPPVPLREPRLWFVAAAFLVVYVVWGSTYLGIRFAIETIPPFLMAGTRFLFAGAILYALTRRSQPEGISRQNWFAAGTVGLLMLLGGNGLVTWAEQYIASGHAALLIATVPLFVVAFDWLLYRAARPTPLAAAGLLLGLVGVYLLIGPSSIAGERLHPLGAGITLLASMFWSLGSLCSRGAKLPRSPFLATSLEMIIAGAAMILLGTALGEWRGFDLTAVSLTSALALLYLSLFGSILALTAYTWLLRVTTAARVSTYAYVNPVVAMVLGALLAEEAMTPRVVVAAGIILASVAMISWTKVKRASTRRSSDPEDGPEIPDVVASSAGACALPGGEPCHLPDGGSAASNPAERVVEDDEEVLSRGSDSTRMPRVETPRAR